jgi:hypothetical protein
MMWNLSMTLPEPKLWDSFFTSSQGSGVLFCPTDDPPTVGQRARVKLTFSGGPRFYLAGVVIWRRPPSKGSQRLRAGAGIQLNPTELQKIDYIRAFSRGGLLEKRRAHRLPVRLQVTYKTRSGRRVNFTRDITDTGILLNAAELLPVQTSVEVTIVPPPNLMPSKLNGTVVRHVDDDRGRAMGIRLDFADEAERGRFATWVRELERTFNGGELSEEFVAP